MSIFLESGTIVAWMAPEEVSAPRGSTRSAEGFRHPCTRSRTEVEAQLRQFSTVLDVVNHVLGIRSTSCTGADSESVSDCAVPSRLVGSARITESCRTSRHRSAPQRLQASSDPLAFVTLGATSSLTPAVDKGRNHHPFDKERTSLPCATVFGCVSSGSLFVTSRPPSYWSRAPLAVWIPGSSNGTFLSWILDRTCVKLRHCQEANTLHQLISL